MCILIGHVVRNEVALWANTWLGCLWLINSGIECRVRFGATLPMEISSIDMRGLYAEQIPQLESHRRVIDDWWQLAINHKLFTGWFSCSRMHLRIVHKLLTETVQLCRQCWLCVHIASTALLPFGSTLIAVIYALFVFAITISKYRYIYCVYCIYAFLRIPMQ